MVDLPNWRESKAITDAVTVLYAKRPGTDSAKLEAAAHSASINAFPIDVLPLDVSSTVLRSRIAAGKPIRYFTPQAVIDYIAGQGLYLPLETEA
jgi:nicotinate-nucleotide adenylyltransferase